MKILLMTYGSRGDVEPFIALGRGFVQAGHSARLAAPGVYAALAAGTGVEYIPLPGDPSALVAAMVRQAGANPLRMIGVMARFVFPLAAEVYARLQAEAPGSDAVVHSFLLTHAGFEIARGLGIPDFSGQLFPMFAPTAAFPAPGFPDPVKAGFFRRWTHILSGGIFRHGGGLLYSLLRRGRSEFPPLSGWPFDPRNGRVTPLLFGFSRQVVPPPADWPDFARITGYWQMDPPEEKAIPAEVRRFVEQGAPPVYVGFGSANPRDTRRFAAIACGAVRAAGRRAILALGGAGRSSGPANEGVLVVDSIPHRWLFPRTCMVVHHGGAGTTGSGLRAGIPNILVPHTADQPFWASRVRALGAGPRAIPLRKFTVPRLAAAIDEALSDAAMRARCRELGAAIDAEDGVARAAARIIAEA